MVAKLVSENPFLFGECSGVFQLLRIVILQETEKDAVLPMRLPGQRSVDQYFTGLSGLPLVLLGLDEMGGSSFPVL